MSIAMENANVQLLNLEANMMASKIIFYKILPVSVSKIYPTSPEEDIGEKRYFELGSFHLKKN